MSGRSRRPRRAWRQAPRPLPSHRRRRRLPPPHAGAAVSRTGCGRYTSGRGPTGRGSGPCSAPPRTASGLCRRRGAVRAAVARAAPRGLRPAPRTTRPWRSMCAAGSPWRRGMLDETSARRRALEECNALVEREVPIVREFDRCVIYAVGNEVVWPYPRAAHAAAALSCRRPSCRRPSRSTPRPCPLINERGRQNLTEHYMKTTRHRALVLGHGPLEWWAPSESDADAIRRNLQTCGQITGRPCVVYSVDDQVVVRVPQLHRVTGIFTPAGRSPADAGRQAAHRALPDRRRLACARGRPTTAGSASCPAGPARPQRSADALARMQQGRRRGVQAARRRPLPGRAEDER